MSARLAAGFPEAAVRTRARLGTADVFPALPDYGRRMFGAVPGWPGADPADPIDRARLVPPIFMDRRLEKLIDLGREPDFADVALTTQVGGFRSPLPLFLSAFGSTALGGTELARAASRQAGQLGIPMVIGENVTPVSGYGGDGPGPALLARIRAYSDHAAPETGGVVVQQSTEDADAEVWNQLYSDPASEPLLATGRLGFELKVGQGAKPGLGGMTVVDEATARGMGHQYTISDVLDGTLRLRSSRPGTFTAEILRHQITLMRNNFPRVKVWVKLPPGRDVAQASAVAWNAGADAVTVDGSEGGTGWAPKTFLQHVGLPLGECLARIGKPAGCLLANGRVWEGARAVKCLALGAHAVGLGRTALVAVDEDPRSGLVRVTEALALELRMLVSSLGKYDVGAVSVEDLWTPALPTGER
jgi:hypothetical protein